MNQRNLLAIGTMLTFALTGAARGAPAASSGLATVESQLKALTGKLDLTEDQQARIKPVLEELHDSTQKLAEDESLSPDERLAKVRPLRYKADRKIREVLNDDQKKKLDRYEQGPHPEMHGSLSGSASH